MSIVYLLVYILGSALVTMGLSRGIQAVFEGSPVGAAVPTLLYGVGAIGLAGLLHALAIRRQLKEGKPSVMPQMKRHHIWGCAAMWAGPLLAGWVQFELFRDPIVMFSQSTLVGGILMTFGVCSQLMVRWRMPWVGTMVTVALVGLPLGWLSSDLLIAHFNHHLTTVVVPLRKEVGGEPRRSVYERDFPDMPLLPRESFDSQLELLAALSEAKAVNFDEEVAAGRMRKLDDGSYVRVASDGEESVVEVADMKKLMEDARETDARRVAEAHAAEMAAWEEDYRRRKQGGRLFTRAAAD
ncbi:hypothetical protein [Myxococcus xanthus]